MWTVGLVLAVKRWRERPQISKLVAIACGVALLTLIFMPVATQIGFQIKFAFVPPLLTLVRTGLGALSIGLLLKAVFVERGKSDLPAPEKPDPSGPAVITGPMGTALKISAGIARWTWRVCSIVPFLFIGVFLFAGIGNYHVSNAGDIIAVAVGVILGVIFLAVMILSWRWEWLGAIFFLIAGVPTLIGFCKGDRGELPECFISVLSMLALLSWSLHTLSDANARPVMRRIAVILAPLIVIAIGYFCLPDAGGKIQPVTENERSGIMKTKFNIHSLLIWIGLVSSLLLAGYRSFGNPLPPDKRAFVGLWKTATGYGLDFNTNSTVNITEDYNWQEIPGWFTVFQRDWNEDNVPVAGGTNYSPPSGMWNFRVMTSF